MSAARDPAASSVPVLVVDENAVARRFVARVVRDSFSDAMQVAECADFGSALASLAAPPPGYPAWRMLVIDIDLPDSGASQLLAAAARASKAAPDERPMLKVVTSLYADDEKLFPALVDGADGYLLKEDRFEVQVEQLQKIARGEPPISPALARRLRDHFDHEARLLSRPESELLAHLSQGYTIREVAQLMSTRTQAVALQIRSVYLKLRRLGRDPATAAG